SPELVTVSLFEKLDDLGACRNSRAVNNAGRNKIWASRPIGLGFPVNGKFELPLNDSAPLSFIKKTNCPLTDCSTLVLTTEDGKGRIASGNRVMISGKSILAPMQNTQL